MDGRRRRRQLRQSFLQHPGGRASPDQAESPITGKSRIQATECEVGVLVSPAHEALGLPPEAPESGVPRTPKRSSAVAARARRPSAPAARSLRRHRDPSEGLLLVYPIDPTPPA